MRKWILALSLSIAACSGGKTGSSNNANNNGNGNGGNGSGSPTALTVHEWGTFTSMAGSGGQSLEGLHHEEVPLPAFVHARAADGAAGMKGLEQQPSGVTQKLETPVLYFYTQTAQPVKVHVDFPKGIVSQWYPSSATFAPAIGSLAEVAGGSMEWQAQLTPGLSGFPSVAADDIWAPSRKVASVPVQMGEEREQFIFYRGVGTFAVPFSASAQADGTLAIKNDSADAIPTVFLLWLRPAGGTIVELGGLEAKQARGNITLPSEAKNIEEYVADASTRVQAALVKTGLYQDEARAMVDTWSKSYFRSNGLRLLYIVPRAWTDQLLPLTITPAPVATVRTLVGRVELLTLADEQQLLQTVQTAAASGTVTGDALAAQLGRFAEPKLRRALALSTDAKVQSYVNSVLPTVQALP